MRVFLAATLIFTWACSAAIAGPKEEALAVMEKWTTAFAESDVDGIVKLYAPDALFMGTGSKTVVKETAGIRKYFEDALLTRRPRAAPMVTTEVMVLSDNVVLVTGLNDTKGVRDGQPYTTPGRVTFVVAQRGSGWQIVHFHRSAMPN